MRFHRFPIVLSLLAFGTSLAQDNVPELVEQGKALYFERVSCWVCHGDNAEGGVGPTLQHGPTPMEKLQLATGQTHTWLILGQDGAATCFQTRCEYVHVRSTAAFPAADGLKTGRRPVRNRVRSCPA